MSPSMACADISLLVRPNRVAVVGASDRPGSLGFSTYHNVRNNSVIPAGAVPVNPRYEAVLGNRAIADVYVAEAPSIAEIEINPLRVMVDANQTSCVALDVVALRP